MPSLLNYVLSMKVSRYEDDFWTVLGLPPEKACSKKRKEIFIYLNKSRSSQSTLSDVFNSFRKVSPNY